MKSDTERRMFHNEKIHKKKNRMHVHLSKDLRTKLKSKKRSIMVRKDDKVKVMRGDHKGKEAKISRVSVLRRKVFLEGIANKNAKGKEFLIPIDPSNLLLIAIEPSKERKELFNDAAFKAKQEAKKEEKPLSHAPKPEVKAEAKQEAKAEAKHEGSAQKSATEHKPEHTEHVASAQHAPKGVSQDTARKVR